MSQQYLRNLSLVVANQHGSGLELGQLRCVFQVRRGDFLTPNTCDIRVYNLLASTANILASQEFTQLSLSVGYQDQQLQRIFQGSIKQARLGREDQRNSYIDFTAADSDEAYNFSATALTLAAGSDQNQGIEALIQQMARAAKGSPTGGNTGQVVTQGYTPTLTGNKTLRARTYYGMCRDELRQLAAHNDCTCSIQDGAITFIPLTGFIPGNIVLITPSTGLIGVPEQTQNGLEITVLLNPAIKVGQLVKLDSTDVNLYRYGLDVASQVLNEKLAQSTTKTNADGLYYVIRPEHFGDTRGIPWYTRLTCLAVDASQNPDNVGQAAVNPDADFLPRY